MLCDLVGSTAMSAQLDPEDMRGVIAAYHKCCSTLIAGNGGFVAKYMGDGVLAYFGYPRAHEHGAEHAVRAGLAVVEAAPKLINAAATPLHIRGGIETGVVVVREACALKPKCCPNAPARKIARSVHEAARDKARAIAKTEAYAVSRRDRKKVEMLFAHLKRILRLGRLRLRGPNGAKDEFLLAATAQNLRKLAKLIPHPTPIFAT
jgi:class 3 adenylate cyclase